MARRGVSYRWRVITARDVGPALPPSFQIMCEINFVIMLVWRVTSYSILTETSFAETAHFAAAIAVIAGLTLTFIVARQPC